MRAAKYKGRRSNREGKRSDGQDGGRRSYLKLGDDMHPGGTPTSLK